MNIFVGNLSYRTMETELRKAFEQYGEVSRVNIPSDRETGKPRGFGFVEMPTRNEAQTAIDALNGIELGGRMLTVNEARPRANAVAGSARRSPDHRNGGNFNRREW